MRESPARRIISFLFRLLRQEHPSWQGVSWPESLTPQSGCFFVIADGFASSSYETSRYKPWIETLKPIVSEISPQCSAIGMSYSVPGIHYQPIDTDIFPLSNAASLVEEYLPTTTPGSQTAIYIGFSLGGTLLALGLASLLDELRRTMEDVSLSATIPALVLVQPVLGIASPYREVVTEVESVQQSAALITFARQAEEVQTRFLSGIETLSREDVPVYLVYWPDDELIEYPQQVVEGMSHMGVHIITIKSLEDPSRNAFASHARVSHDPNVLQHIKGICETLP